MHTELDGRGLRRGQRVVTLRDLHAFEYGGKHWALDVQSLAVRELDFSIYEVLARDLASRSRQVSPDMSRRLDRLGLLADGIDEDPRPLPAPRIAGIGKVSINVAQLCNLDCTYCYADGGEYGAPGLMKPHTLDATLSWLLTSPDLAPHVHVFFFGGEPLLNFPAITRAVEALARGGAEAGRSFAYTINTNGTLIKDEHLQFAKTHDIEIRVSFDGDRETHDENRPLKKGGPSFDLVSNNVRRALKVLPNLVGRATVVAGTSREEVVERLIGHGFKDYEVKTAGPSSRGGPVGEDESDHFRKLADEALIAARENRPADISSPIRSVLRALITQQTQLRHCGVGCRQVGVSSDGQLYPCSMFVGVEGYEMGTVHDGALDQQAYEAMRTEPSPTCSSCWALNLCSRGCARNNVLASGSMLDPDPKFCRSSKALIEAVVRLVGELAPTERAGLIRHLR